MGILEIVRGNLGISIISGIVGAAIAAVAAKLNGRRASLRYSTRADRVALSAEDPIFGSVRVTLENAPVRNLHTVLVEVENTSSRDFEDVDLKVYTDGGTHLLNERTSVVGTPYIVEWSDEFKRALAVAPGSAAPATNQLDIYWHSREYRLGVFNRGQLLQFSYLCTRPQDDMPPTAFVGTRLKGARLRRQEQSSLVYGVPLQAALYRGLGIACTTVALCGVLLRNAWAASAVSMAVGLSAQLCGVLLYKAERWLRNLIVG
jgi:hypothetical protein